MRQEEVEGGSVPKVREVRKVELGCAKKCKKGCKSEL